MGVANPFNGGRKQWLEENGWRHAVAASESGWELRVYPDARQVRISRSRDLLVSAATVERTIDGWVVRGTQQAVERHPAFVDVHSAFEWWIRRGRLTLTDSLY